MKPSALHLARLVSSQQWAILQTDPALAMLKGLAAGAIAVDLDQEAFAARMTAQSYRERIGAQKAGTVQIIPVYGILTQRYDWMTWIMDGTGLDWLREAIAEAVADPDVSAIVLDVNSPGGSVNGCTEFAADLRTLRDVGGKPIVAVANPQMASAAYWTLSQSSEIVVVPSGAVGSIGVVAIHCDISRMLDMAGETITLIYSGAHKTEGNPFQPLDEEALKQLQSESEHYYSMFLADDAKGRGITAAVVAETFGQGRMVFPAAALAAGMVDRVDTFDNTVRRLARVRLAATGSSRARAALRPDGMSGAVAVGYGLDFEAAAIAKHKTATDSGAWDGPMMEKNCPAEEAPLRASHAWVDDAGDPAVKGSYKFIHHMVGMDGAVGAANETGCSTGIGYLNRAPGSSGRPDIPDADRQGVWDHLAGHLRDAHADDPQYEPPALSGQGAPIGLFAAVTAEAALEELLPDEEPNDGDEITAEPEPDAARAAPIPISSRRRDPAWVAANAAAFDQAAHNVAAPRWFERSSSR